MAREDDGIAMMPAGMPGIGEEHAREPDSQTVEATWLWRYAEFHKERLGKPGTRYLVYQCTGRAANPREACGGLGDRFSGIVSTLYLAVVTNRVFLIDYSYPAPLIDSLLPNAIDWHSNASVMDQGTPLIFNVDKETESTRSLVARCQGDEPAIVIRAAWARWCLYLWSPALSAELRQMYSMGFPHPVFGTWHLWDDNKRPYDMYFTWAFDFLFRRSPALDAAVDRLRSSMGLPQPGQGPWVGVHMRFGKQEGWNDTVVMISKGQLNRTLDQLTRAVVVSIRQLHFICGGMDHGLGRASEVAKTVRPLPTVASCCEGNWAVNKFIHNKRRNRLSTAWDLVSLYHNMRCMNSRRDNPKYKEMGGNAGSMEESGTSSSSDEELAARGKKAKGKAVAQRTTTVLGKEAAQAGKKTGQ
eukprot:jgi/Mesvir1/4854/Mv11129-RA.1